MVGLGYTSVGLVVVVVGEYISLACKGGLRQLSTSMLWGHPIPFLLAAAITASSMRCLLLKKFI